MATDLSKFGLIASLMKRLDISPSILTLQWLNERVLTHTYCVNGTEVGLSERCSSNNFVKQEDECSVKIENEEKETLEADKKADKDVSIAADSSLVSDDFYDQNWRSIDNEFELTKQTTAQVRYGMYVYFHADKKIVRTQPMLQRVMKKQNCIFFGIVFDKQEDKILLINVVEERCGYGRALKNLVSGRFPYMDETTKIFVYQKHLKASFVKLFKKMPEKFFCESDEKQDGVVSIFDLKQGTVENQQAKYAVAGSFRVIIL